MSIPQITLDQTMDNSRMHNIDALQQAARFLDRCLMKDNTAPTLLEQLNIGNQQNTTTASGLSDHDYPILNGLPQSLANKTQMKTVNRVPMPAEIMEHFNHMQCHCMMGLFPEINRAWLTIDSDIYLWTFEDGGDVAYYDGLNETILSVGLIKPKHAVFQNFVKHLLVLATAVDIVVLGVTFTSDEDDALKEIQLFSEPVFSIPTDGALVTTFVGTNLGRLFFGTKDGCLYEITYQAESSWFGKRCKKINHSTSKLAFLVPSFAYAAIANEDSVQQIVIDDTRNILYVLTEKGTIEAYDLGETGTSLSKIGKLTQTYIVHQAHSIVKTLDSQNFHPIVSISAVELTESARIHLVAITQSGVRLYLTTFTQSQINLPNPRPTTLALLHVRLPPGYSASAHYRPRAIHMANYRERTLVMVSTVAEKEALWCLSSDLFPFCPSLMEAMTTIDLDGPVLALAEIKYPTNVLLQPTQQVPPLVVRQHSEPPRKYIILTAQGAHILIKQRPVDLLKQLLLETRALDTDVLKAFFSIQQEEQACATSLILASLESPQNADLSEHATTAFFIFGGEPQLAPQYGGVMGSQQYNQPQQFGASMFLPNMMSTPMGSNNPYQMAPQSPNQSFAAPSFYGSPMNQNQNFVPMPQNPQMLGTNALYDANCPFYFSPKHNGLYLYVGRILRPIWNLRCVEKMTLDAKKFYLTSAIDHESCAWILCHLESLCNFLQRNTQLTICSAKYQADASKHSRSRLTQQDAQLEERQSLESLKLFVNHATQVIGLWKILTQHQFHILMESLSSNHQQLLQNTTFKDVFLFGHEICCNLINSLINSYLGDNASVDSISAKLRDTCPSLYKAEDAACSKANEMLKTAKHVMNIDEREELLHQALALCKNVAPNVNLTEICGQFTALKAYQAVVELCVTCAKKFDPEDIAVHFYKNADQNDEDAYQFYLRRMEVYKEVVAMLDSVYSVHDAQNITNINGLQVQGQGEPVQESSASQITRKIITEILRENDELLHIAVYEWMMNKQMNGDLISIQQPTLETFLVKASQRNPNNIPLMDILWKYYESNNNHAAAARVLNALASSEDNGLMLRDRLTYLARALMCMRSDKVGYAPYLGVFLRELEDKLEVAKVQERVLDAVVILKGRHTDAEMAEQLLNAKLFEITQLYEEFADKFELWECKLAIINCAGYSDTLLIENIWSNIIQNELQKAGAFGNDTLIHILSKIKSLVKIYKGSGSCVPLDYLVLELERISAQLKADTSLVPNFFVSLDYTVEDLISSYNSAMASAAKDNFWSNETNENHFSEAIGAVIQAFINTQDKYTNADKRKMIAISMDTVAGLLSILYSKPNTDRVVNQLRLVQTRLSRM